MARGQSPYQGAYSFPVQSTVEQSLARGAQAQAQMYSNLGRGLGAAANTYFEAKAENEQIEAIASDPRILDMVYKGRTDMPADPKQRKKDVKALYREMGGRKGIEQLIRMDEADARNKQLFDLQKETHAREKDKYERLIKAEQDKLSAFESVYFPKDVPIEVVDPVAAILGEGFEEHLGGLTLGDLGIVPQTPMDETISIFREQHELLLEKSKEPINLRWGDEEPDEARRLKGEAAWRKGREEMPSIIPRMIMETRDFTEDQKREILKGIGWDESQLVTNPYASGEEEQKALVASRREHTLDEAGKLETTPAGARDIEEYTPENLGEIRNRFAQGASAGRFLGIGVQGQGAKNEQHEFARLWEDIDTATKTVNGKVVDATDAQKASARQTLQEVLHPPEPKASYLGGITKALGLEGAYEGLEEKLTSARRTLADVTLPEKLYEEVPTITTTQTLPSPMSAGTQEEMLQMIQDQNPEMSRESLPYVLKLVQGSGKPTIAQSGHSGIKSWVAKDKQYYWNKQEAETDYLARSKKLGRIPTEANVENFRETARIMDAEKINDKMTSALKHRKIFAAGDKMDALKEARKVINGAMKNSALVGAASDTFARIFQPNGILTDDDIMRLGGQSEELVEKIHTKFKLATDGTLNKTQGEDMLLVIERMETSQKADLNKNIPLIARAFADRYSITEPDVYEKTMLSKYKKFFPRSAVETSRSIDQKLVSMRILDNNGQLTPEAERTVIDPRHGKLVVTEKFEGDKGYLVTGREGDFVYKPQMTLTGSPEQNGGGNGGGAGGGGDEEEEEEVIDYSGKPNIKSPAQPAEEAGAWYEDLLEYEPQPGSTMAYIVNAMPAKQLQNWIFPELIPY